MWRCSLPYLLTPTLLAIPALPGCHALEGGRPVAILVRDAETKAPIAGADIQVASVSGHLPKIVGSTTGADGIAHVKVDPAATIGYGVEVTARGYLTEEEDLSVDALAATVPVGLARFSGNNPAPAIVEMFAGPRPTIELIVPNGYLGVLRAQIRARDDAPFPLGQRTFTFTVPASGLVEAVGPPVFHHGLVPDIRAKYADGSPLPRDAKDDAVSLRLGRAATGTTRFSSLASAWTGPSTASRLRSTSPAPRAVAAAEAGLAAAADAEAVAWAAAGWEVAYAVRASNSPCVVVRPCV